jgi:hypothetical protein
MPSFDEPINGVSHSQALKQAWVHADGSVVQHDTLTFSCAAFLDDSNQPFEARFVNDTQDLAATLEDDAPLNAGEEVVFTACPFDMDLSAEKEGGIPDISITVDNISREVSELLLRTLGTRDKISVTYRRYLSSDTTGPHTLPVTRLTLQTAIPDVDRVEATAGFGELHDTRFPADVHDVERFPGLTAR